MHQMTTDSIVGWAQYVLYICAFCAGTLLMFGVMVTSCSTDNGIYAFDQNAVYLEGEACTVNLEDHISEEYARTMFDTCLEYHSLYLEKVNIQTIGLE